ncbi:MAG: HAMP domain-containing histidine kinase [Lachnospiraceae bacterium]|nr:HAMP domain-containing histidine kinase [Lachnospiraceae bacterium]
MEKEIIKGDSIRVFLKRALFPLVVIFFLAAFFFASRLRFEQKTPKIVHEYGFADLRECDFENTVYNLLNNWDYFPGVLYTAEDFADEENAPQPDNEVPYDRELGTYRIRFLAKPRQWLSMCGFSVDYGTRVFLNGEEIRNVGFVSADPAEAVPKVRYMTIPMYSGENGEIELIYQYSNYVHNDGGFIKVAYISTPENIDEYRRGLTYFSLLTGSGLIFLMFWFLLSASIQKSREYAALALCCLVIALRNQFFFAEHMLGPGYDFFLEYRITVLDTSLIPISALYLLFAFFPKAVGKKIVYGLTGVSIILIALHWILDVRDLVDLCHISYYSCVPFLLWSIFCLGRYYIKVKRPDRMEWISLGGVSLLIVMLIREGISTGETQSITTFGITPFVLVICLMILAIVINGRIRRQMLALEETKQKNRLLEQINDTNRDFLRMVAHELKTPLTVISGYAQLTERQLQKSGQPEKMTGRLKTIRDEAERLGTIVSRLMDYTYNRAQDVEMSEVDVQELLNSVESIMSPVCAKKENLLSIRNSFSGTVSGNRELLLQVLINLIANACRHTEKGTISIITEENEKEAVFNVSDTGSGIPPEAVPHIFEKGYTTGQGNGLGLAICLESVELHGGTMELVSTGPGGTGFRFTIPKEKREALPA